jgi:Tol biopolymer transport system component
MTSIHPFVAVLATSLAICLPVSGQLQPSAGRAPSAGAGAELRAVAKGAQRLNHNTYGLQADGSADVAAVSADGRCVAFSSVASNLEYSGDTTGLRDVFVRDIGPGTTSLISAGLAGGPGNGASGASLDLSADGRVVVFDSWASDLVLDDVGGELDVFVHDRQSGVTERISVASDGTPANGPSTGGSVSADGRFVAFTSWADNLVAQDVNNVEDVFVHDRLLGTTVRISEELDGTDGEASSHSPAISASGQFVAFATRANNLVPDALGEYMYIFVHDLLSGETVHVSKNDLGQFSHGDCDTKPAISADGRFVAFATYAYNLDVTIGDWNGVHDVFVHDRQQATTRRVSANAMGHEGNGGSILPTLSADGRFVAFTSGASNLTASDGNGVADVFVHDRHTGELRCASLKPTGSTAQGASGSALLTADGQQLVFLSAADDLVLDDTNGVQDVFRTKLP